MTNKRFASTIAITAIVSIGSLFQTMQIAQALDLSTLSDEQWDVYSGDNTRFDGIVWTGNCGETQDERSKTPTEIAQLYTNLSTAVLGKRYTMTAGYLYDKSYYCGIGKWHSAIDFGAPVGTSVKALGSGTVAWIDTTNSSTNGVFIAVNDDKDGKQWIYGHLQNSGSFRTGTRVTSGQVIGQVGSQAKHLHLEVRTSPFKSANKGNQASVRDTTMSPLQAFWLKSGNVSSTPPTNGGAFQQPNVKSEISINVQTIDLTITASNLSGKTVYVQMWRPAINGNPEKTWNYNKNATGTSITFNDLDGPGNTFPGVDYYTVASLSPIASGEAAKRSTGCYLPTNRMRLCDTKRR
jgi:murein DD-endopeptidase MepM/ murein hydrolase activator NlpD